MKNRNSGERGVFVVRNVEAIVSLAVAIAGVCVWSYSTFATKEYVATLVTMIESNKKDTQSLITTMQATTDRQITTLTQGIESIRRDSQIYSDHNRERMEALFLDLKEEVRGGPMKARHTAR